MLMLAQKVAGTLGPLALMAAALPVSAQPAQTALSPAAPPLAAPLLAPTKPDALPPMEEIHLGQDARTRLTVPVTIGKAGPFAFLVDTGAERTVLTRQTAQTLGLAPSGRATLVSVAGLEDVDLVTVAEMSLGTRRFSGLEAPLVDGHDLEAEGIVGLDGLQDQRVTIDFAAHRMMIGNAAPDAPHADSYDIVVTARRRSGQLIMTEATVDGVRTDVMIDTGSDTSIGNRALQRALNRRQGDQQARLIAVTGQVITADVGQARVMRIGGMDIRNLTFAFADAPAFAHLKLSRRPALLLGMRDLSAFQKVGIDFARRRVMFDFTSASPQALAAR